jgi:hypothetical protein
MPAFRTVTDVTIGDWEHEGEFREDTQYYDTTYAIIAHTPDGKFVHENAFMNDPDGAERFSRRVAERGVINLAHWGFHEFWSLTMEERFEAEAYHENLHRHGMGDYSHGVFSGGHV